jgi:hypothetical protein
MVRIVLSVLIVAAPAMAAPASWCKTSFEVSSYDLGRLRSQDGQEVLPVLARAACSSSPEVEAHRAELEQARAEWGAAYGMEDADWADMVAFLGVTSFSFKPDFSTKSLADFTPIDQYAAIREPFEDNGHEISDALYIADALDGSLSQVGRLAFLEDCVRRGSFSFGEPDPVEWALCQADIDAFDLKKLYEELRADKAHDAATRAWLRMRAHDLPAAVGEIAAKKAALVKKDSEYGKLFSVAAKAREAWRKEVGTNSALLALVGSTDSGRLFHSRKLLDGCEAKTADALGRAVATLPAKAFVGMHDDRENPYKGFAYRAGPLLARTPLVSLAAVAYIECRPNSGAADFLATAILGSPGARGPRSAALAAIMGETFTFDDTSKKGLQFRPLGGRPYNSSGGANGSAGGVVKSVKTAGSALTVALEKTTAKQWDCVKEHRGRLSRIRNDGSLEYEIICDGTKLVMRDTTWGDFHLAAAWEKWLKPGVVFSSTSKGGEPGDVIAIWPDKNASAPSMVLGARVR